MRDPVLDRYNYLYPETKIANLQVDRCTQLRSSTVKRTDRDSLPIVPELAGCSAFGETEEGALQEVKIAMKPRLQTAKEICRVIPVPQKHVSWADLHTILSIHGEKFR